jgi:hypothetical protein
VPAQPDSAKNPSSRAQGKDSNLCGFTALTSALRAPG